jgi:NAD-dependent dihydropyrimidine dehydrogenase PreA subunit
MKREIITINEEKCTGCGLCIPECPEGAIQVIDGKARLVSDLFCDGLGACLGHCPQGAISIEKREAEPYNETRVMHNVVKQGVNTIRAHLKHLKEHGETDYYNQAVQYLQEHDLKIPELDKEQKITASSGCPGLQSVQFDKPDVKENNKTNPPVSQLRHWPVQLHLISPAALQYKKADLLLAADCTAFTAGDFHNDFLAGKVLAIACPKLDEGQKIYLEKLRTLIDDAEINTLTVLVMQVPCCRGLLALAKQAVEKSHRKVPIKLVVLSIKGKVLKEEWYK